MQVQRSLKMLEAVYTKEVTDATKMPPLLKTLDQLNVQWDRLHEAAVEFGISVAPRGSKKRAAAKTT